MPATATRVPRSRTATPASVEVLAGDADALVREHLGLVHHVARKLAGHLAGDAEMEEMVSAGAVGLLQAASAFDPSRGLSFSTFAVPRIRGAILDELRRQDHATRSVRRKARELGAARDALAARLRRRPTDAEVAAHLGVTPGLVRQWELDIEGSVRVAIDRPSRAGTRRACPLDLLADDAPAMDDLLTHEQEITRLQHAMATLKEQERTVLALYYFEELKLHEIGEVIGLSACRISQIRTGAIAKLRESLSALRVA